jgi:hypothetical protein
MKNFTESVEDILSNFDWQRVLTVMEALDWKYSVPNEGQRRPTLDDIQATARKILTEAVSGPAPRVICQGGFRAELYPDELELLFVVEEISTDAL